MKNLISQIAFFLSIFAIICCDDKPNTSTAAIDSIQTSLRMATELDSNFVLENITSLSSFLEIEKKFGNENLKKDSTIAGPEGTKLKVSVLYPNSANAVVLHWDEKQAFNKLHSVVISCDSVGYKGKWHTKMGLQPGLLLDKVVKLNNKTFTISGFGWDYGGHIVSWEGGKLGNKGITGRFSDYGKDKIDESEYRSVSGDTEFNVSLNAIKKLNPVLVELTMFARN